MLQLDHLMLQLDHPWPSLALRCTPRGSETSGSFHGDWQ
jgi:hypothetical protein